jgi:hypothetical protein
MRTDAILLMPSRGHAQLQDMLMMVIGDEDDDDDDDDDE